MIPQMVTSPEVQPPEFTFRTVTGAPRFGNTGDINTNLSFSRKKKPYWGLSFPQLLPSVAIIYG